MTDWQGKIVLVTGGSAGLGRFIAQAFGRAGAKVVIAARNEQQLQAAAAALKAEDLDATPIVADVTRQRDVERMFIEIDQQFGRLDVLVNNAGRSGRGKAIETSVDELRELIELNFLGLVRSTQAAMPALLKSQGHLVNIGSLAAKTVSPYLGAYPASKFPVAAYSHQLRLELGPQGLHVLLVCPGPVALPDRPDRYAKLAAEKDLPAAASQAGAGVKLKGIDPAWLSEKIVRACEQRRPELIVPRRARWLFAVTALWPRVGDWIIRRMTR